MLQRETVEGLFSSFLETVSLCFSFRWSQGAGYRAEKLPFFTAALFSSSSSIEARIRIGSYSYDFKGDLNEYKWMSD